MIRKIDTEVKLPAPTFLCWGSLGKLSNLKEMSFALYNVHV